MSNENGKVMKPISRGMGDGSVVRSTCFSREFSALMLSGSQLPVIPAPEDPIPSYGLFRYHIYGHTHTHTHTHTYVHIHMHTCTLTHINTNAHTHTSKHTHTHSSVLSKTQSTQLTMMSCLVLKVLM